MRKISISSILFFIAAWGSQASSQDGFLVGSGIHDVTGEPADNMMMGYVDPKQTSAGIHTRLRSRALVVADPATNRHVAMVTIDACSSYQVVKTEALRLLRNEIGDIYTDDNTLITATHTHSAQGGFDHFKLYYLSTLGYANQSFHYYAQGIYQSILKAHKNLAPGTITMAQGELLGLSVNRSLAAYRQNPFDERTSFAYDTDKVMTVLRFNGKDGSKVGMTSYYPIHVTSVQVKNKLLSGDNKGYAAQLFERAMGTDYRQDKTFVAAFANANAGDSSPQTARADLNGDGDWDCPLIDMFACNRASGKAQFQKALSLFNSATKSLQGVLDYRHRWIDMSRIQVEPDLTPDGIPHKTCPGAIGLSMLAGAEDHRGVGVEGESCSTGGTLAKVLCKRPESSCHGEKPVVLATGSKNPPWTPQVMPIQIIRIGSLALVALPGEFTTMAGRRIRAQVYQELSPAGVTHVVLAGYANSYAGYVATREEYQLQEYEGASTHFGEWTQLAYQQEFRNLARSMRLGLATPSTATPFDASTEPKRIIQKSSRSFDATPRGKAFGDIIEDTASTYKTGETASVSFWGGYPNHNPMIQSSFLEVQRLDVDKWTPVFFDWDEETKYIWNDAGKNQSKVTIDWTIPENTTPGRYRILHRGFAKSQRGDLQPYHGTSREFSVNNPDLEIKTGL